MSYLDLQQALLTKLVNAQLVDNVAFENGSFDPTGLSEWISVNVLPATETIMGKNATSGNERRGIFQISVYVKKDADDYANGQLTLIDSILGEFVYNSTETFNSQTVHILESTVSPGRTDEAWYVRDISINYLLFSAR